MTLISSLPTAMIALLRLKSTMNRVIGLDLSVLKDKSVMATLRKALNGDIAQYEGPYFATVSDANG